MTARRPLADRLAEKEAARVREHAEAAARLQRRYGQADDGR